MRKLTLPTMILAALLMTFGSVVWAQEESAKKAEEGKKAEEQEQFEYVGHQKCKICHKEQHATWLETGHANAFDLLTDEEKKKPECVSCHITGKTADGELLEGVQCEACHGPGSEYKSPKIMNKKKWAAEPEKYTQMAMDAGLIMPHEAVCTQCHKKEGNPNFKPFDYAEKKPKVHALSEEAAKIDPEELEKKVEKKEESKGE